MNQLRKVSPTTSANPYPPSLYRTQLGIGLPDAAGCELRAGFVVSMWSGEPQESIPSPEKGGHMGQLPAWTTVVSDHLMDVQLAVTRLAERDGVIDEHELSVLQAIKEAQGGVRSVHNEISVVASLITRGRVPDYHKDIATEVFGANPNAA